MPTRELTLQCDNYILAALEAEARSINRKNVESGLDRIEIDELAREVLADWAIDLLLAHLDSRPEAHGNGPARAAN